MDEVLKGRINGLMLEFDRARAALERARTAIRPEVHISPAVLERFGTAMRENLTAGAVPFRKAVITSFVDRIEVDDHEIRIMGDNGTLERAVVGGSGSDGGGQAGVRSLVRSWRRGSPTGHAGFAGVSACPRALHHILYHMPGCDGRCNSLVCPSLHPTDACRRPGHNVTM